MKTDVQPEQNSSLFIKVVILCVLAFLLFGVIFNYSINWMSAEVAGRDLPSAIKNGTDFQLIDLLRGFDYMGFDVHPRARAVSYVCQLLTIKFRLWLFDYIPVHPSLALSDIFSYCFSPLLLFLFVREYTSCRKAAIYAVLLYVTSVGLLSNTLMLNHPGKPLSNFFTIFCLFLGSRIVRPLRFYGHLGVREKSLYALLLLVMFIAFNTDETTYFLFVAIPLIFFRDVFEISFDEPVKLSFRSIWSQIRNLSMSTFAIKKSGHLIVYLYPLSLVSFLVFVTFIVPVITRSMGWGDFDYWGFVGFTADRYHYSPYPLITKLLHFFFNMYNLTVSHVVPHFDGVFIQQTTARREWISIRYLAVAGILTILLFYASHPFKYLAKQGREKLIHIAVTLFFFCIFHTALHTRYADIPAHGAYYYGANFSIYFSIALAILLSVEKGWLSWSNKILLVVLLVTFSFNSIALNEQWMKGNPRVYRQYYDEQMVDMNDDKRLSLSLAKRVWDNRHDKETLEQMKVGFPSIAYHLLSNLNT